MMVIWLVLASHHTVQGFRRSACADITFLSSCIEAHASVHRAFSNKQADWLAKVLLQIEVLAISDKMKSDIRVTKRLQPHRHY